MNDEPIESERGDLAGPVAAIVELVVLVVAVVLITTAQAPLVLVAAWLSLILVGFRRSLRRAQERRRILGDPERQPDAADLAEASEGWGWDVVGTGLLGWLALLVSRDVFYSFQSELWSYLLLEAPVALAAIAATAGLGRESVERLLLRSQLARLPTPDDELGLEEADRPAIPAGESRPN